MKVFQELISSFDIGLLSSGDISPRSNINIYPSAIELIGFRLTNHVPSVLISYINRTQFH